MALKLALLCLEIDDTRNKNITISTDTDGMDKIEILNDEVSEELKHIANLLFKCIEEILMTKFEENFSPMIRKKIIPIDSILTLATVSLIPNLSSRTPTKSNLAKCMIGTIKFYKLDTTIGRYKITIDIEQLLDNSSSMDFELGIKNQDLDLLGETIKLKLNVDKIECVPIIKRGRLDKPHFLVSSDERVLEYDFDKVLIDCRSKYQDVKILHSPSLGNTLLLDNLQNLAEIDLDYTYGLMDLGNYKYTDKEILILGGGDGGLLHELLKEQPKFVTMIDIDEVVINGCRDHLKPCGETMRELRGNNYEIIIDDCFVWLEKYINVEQKKFDVIFNDLTDIPVMDKAHKPFSQQISDTANKSSSTLTLSFAGDNQWNFIEKIFIMSLKCLKSDGFYMNHATGSGNLKALKAYEDFLSMSPVKVKFERRSRFVPSFMENWVFYTIRFSQ